MSASGDKGPLQWHLDGVLGGKLWECLLQSSWAGVQKWCLELLLDLLLGLDALHWLLRTEPSLPSQQSASVLSWQSQEASVYGRQWAVSLWSL